MSKYLQFKQHCVYSGNELSEKGLTNDAVTCNGADLVIACVLLRLKYHQAELLIL